MEYNIVEFYIYNKKENHIRHLLPAGLYGSRTVSWVHAEIFTPIQVCLIINGNILLNQTRRFISLSEIGFASPLSSTATRPDLMMVPSVGFTTMPARLL